VSGEYAADDVNQAERETTRRMVARLLSMLADEPPQDAGGHPSLPVHEQVGAAWADWDKQRRAWLTLLAPRLLREAMADVRGGPHAVVRSPEADPC
jgi:hypothetical protein